MTTLAKNTANSKNNFSLILKNQVGVVRIIPVLVIVAIFGIVAFLLISSTLPIGGIFSSLYPKPASHAAGPLTGPIGTPVPSGVTLSIDPATSSLAIDGTIPLTLDMFTASDRVSAAELHISFNPALVQVTSITAGTFLPVVLVPGAFDNTGGTASIILGSNPTTPATGSGTLATVNFKSVGPTGTASIQYTFNSGQTTQTASVGKTGNTLSAFNGATINITSIPGDINNDGKVDIFDYNILLTNFGKTGAGLQSQGDINGDGKIDIFDYNIVVTNFGQHL